MYAFSIHLEQHEPSRHRHVSGLEDQEDEDGKVGRQEGPTDQVNRDDGPDVGHQGQPHFVGVDDHCSDDLDVGKEDDHHGKGYEEAGEYFGGEVGGVAGQVVAGPANQDLGVVKGVGALEQPHHHRDRAEDPDAGYENLDVGYADVFALVGRLLQDPNPVA